jgi:formylglycine-generating enzyme required for sulfatase activity
MKNVAQHGRKAPRISTISTLLVLLSFALLYRANASENTNTEFLEMKVLPRSNRAISLIAVSVTPVTFAQWDRCVADGGCNGYTPDRQGLPRDAPVVNVSYNDAQSYVNWLTKKTGQRYRLLREREWAQVALGGAKTKYPWGDAVGRANTNCLNCGSRWDAKSPNPVRSFKPNAVGLYDIVGNVAHWTEPDAHSRANATHLNKTVCAQKAEYAAIFGASWAESSKYLDVNEWACFPKVLRDDTIGFRVVRE